MPPPAATQAAARLWTACVTNPPHLPRIPPKCRGNGNCTICSSLKLATKLAECMTPSAGSVRQFTRGRVRELKNGHNSVTVQNRTHVYTNFFHHKDLGNHPLQLCPKVVKHPVYVYTYIILYGGFADSACVWWDYSKVTSSWRLTYWLTE